ncbi:hypothetical protein C3744_26445 [Priestia megaterium]|uniref:Uncharacterized protein n=1 Tax=Priestia megaterium TaxID=1404 RepID=A0A3D8WUK8_PRIMG|nr:hypothetical protein C3744_26445 [Priestia megaterium]
MQQLVQQLVQRLRNKDATKTIIKELKKMIIQHVLIIKHFFLHLNEQDELIAGMQMFLSASTSIQQQTKKLQGMKILFTNMLL